MEPGTTSSSLSPRDLKLAAHEVDKADNRLRTDHCVPVDNTDNTLRAGPTA